MLAGYAHARSDVNSVAVSGGHLLSDLPGSVQRAVGLGHGTLYMTSPRGDFG